MPAELQIPGTAPLSLPYDFGATQSYPLGTILKEFTGRQWRYGSQNASTAAAAGAVYQSPVPDTGMDELAVAAAAVGARSVTVTLGATQAAADDFNGGFVVVEDDAGEGYAYLVEDTPAISASAAGAISLAHGIEVALTSSSTVALLKHPGKLVIIHPSPPTAPIYGVAAAAISTSQFGWYQYRGLAGVATEGTPVIAKQVRASETTDGAVTALDYDESAQDDAILGTVLEVAATTEKSTILLNIA